MLCCNLNISSLVVELDAKAVVDIFLNPSYHNNVVSPILDDRRQLVRLFRQVQFKHCHCQANRCADMLARMSTKQDVEFITFDCPSVDIRNMLDEDSARLYVNRVAL